MREWWERGRALVLSEGGARVFVWSAWLVQSWLLWCYVSEFSVDLPRYDDWEMVPVLAGQKPVTLAWLWSQHNEHRIFIPRLLYLIVTKLSGDDFRACVFFDIFLLSVSAAALMISARKLRGKTSYADAFFPLVLLHLGQADNLVWSFQIQFVASSALVMSVLCALTRTEPKVDERAALWVGVSTFLLPLFGGNGLGLVPALGLCTLSLAWQLRNDAPTRHTWKVVAGLGLLSFAMTAAYFIGYHRPAGHPTSPSLAATWLAIRQVLSFCLGSGMITAWPRFQGLVPTLIAVPLVLLLYRLIKLPGSRWASLRFGLVIGGMLALVSGIAWARIAVYPGGVFASRYVPLLGPILCAVYLLWELLPWRRLGRAAQFILLVLSAILLPRNRETGIAEGAISKGDREAALHDITHGMPLSEVTERHCWSLYVCDQQPVLLERMRLMHDKKMGAFTNANPN